MFDTEVSANVLCYSANFLLVRFKSVEQKSYLSLIATWRCHLPPPFPDRRLMEELSGHYTWGRGQQVTVCIICRDRRVNVQLFNCHHRVLCFICLLHHRVRLCPWRRCQRQIEYYWRFWPGVRFVESENWYICRTRYVSLCYLTAVLKRHLLVLFYHYYR